MKKLGYALLTLALMAPVGLLAQDNATGQGQANTTQETGRGRHRMHNVDDQVAHLSKKLKLTDEQKPQVKSILEQQRDQMQQVWQNSSASRDEKRQKTQEIHQDASSKIKAVLTDDQKAKYEKLEAKHEQRMEKHQHGGQAANPSASNQQPQ